MKQSSVRRKRPKSVNLIADAEWNFCSQSKDWDYDEQTACMYYEYARESMILRALSEMFRPAWEQHLRRHTITDSSLNQLLLVAQQEGLFSEFTFPKHGNFDQDELKVELQRAVKRSIHHSFASPLVMLSHLDFAWCVLWPERFPHTPWTEIPAGERRARLQFFEAPHPTLEEIEFEEFQELLTKDAKPNASKSELAEVAWETLTTSEGFIEQDGKGWREVVHLRINTTQDRKIIIEAFANWLRPNRLDQYRRRKPSQKRIDFVAMLQPASMRILHSASWAEAKLDARFCDLLQSEQGKSTRTRHKVKRRMAELFRAELLGAETPLNFMTWNEQRKLLAS